MVRKKYMLFGFPCEGKIRLFKLMAKVVVLPATAMKLHDLAFCIGEISLVVLG